jgi:hypothetical protein
MCFVISQGGIPTAAPSSGLSEILFSGTANFASGLFITIVVLFFCLCPEVGFFAGLLKPFRDFVTSERRSRYRKRSKAT